MFYDNFTQDQICGIFTFWHFVAMGIFVVLAIVALVLSRKMTEKQVKKTMLIVAIIVTVLEIVKIIIRLYKHSNLNGWVPLYFCSLFIYAIWFALCKNEFVKNMGYCFLVCGGIAGSVCYTIYPTTSLLLYPIWHPAAIHGLFYHWCMFYIGVLVAMRGLYKPKARDFVHYLMFTTIFTVLALIINQFTGSNLMLISHPFGIKFLQDIYNVSPFLHAFVVYFGQSIALYWAEYGLYKLIYHITQKNKSKKQPKPNIEDDQPNLSEI